MSKVLRTVFHGVAAAHFWFACFYDWNYVKVPRSIHRIGDGYGKKLIFLTFWDAIIQAVFFSICFVNDLIGNEQEAVTTTANRRSEKPVPQIRRIRDHLFCSLAFPLSQFVAITFWGLYIVDRELVFPKVLDAYFPLWLNHFVHTDIAVCTFIELFTSRRYYPTRKDGLTTLLAVLVCYLVWMNILRYLSGYWVYPVMHVLNIPLKVVFILGLLVFTVGLYVLGENLNAMRWGLKPKRN